MTGLDVLLQCQTFYVDMQRMSTVWHIAMDAATHVTQSFDGIGASGDKTSSPERFTVMADGVSRRMQARRAMYAMELAEAAHIIQKLPPASQDVVRRRMIDGETIRMIATTRKTTLDGVRSMLRRARVTMSEMESDLDTDENYKRFVKEYHECKKRV